MWARRWCLRRIWTCGGAVRLCGLLACMVMTIMPSLLILSGSAPEEGRQYGVLHLDDVKRPDKTAGTLGDYQSPGKGTERKPQAAPAALGSSNTTSSAVSPTRIGSGNGNGKLTAAAAMNLSLGPTSGDLAASPLPGPPTVPVPGVQPGSGFDGSRQQRLVNGAVEDPCRSVFLTYPPGPKTALFSFPGSGNTWIRHLIQIATGLATGSVYYDMTLKRTGFDGEGVRDGRAVVIKTHEAPRHSQVKFDKMVMIIRNPFGALKAEFNRRHGGHLGHARAQIYAKNNGQYWREYAVEGAKQWEETTRQWLDFRKYISIHVVTYEDMRRDTWGQLADIVRFLNATRRVDDSWHRCRDRHVKGHFQRARQQLPFRLYTSDMVAEIERRIKSVARSLAEALPDISSSGLLRSFKNRNLTLDSMDFAFLRYEGEL